MTDDGWTEELPWLGQYILDEQGNPQPATSLLSWGEWMETGERQLALDRVGTVHVSTIFMGLDTTFHWGHITNYDPLLYKPTLWETMIFGGAMDLTSWRYKSKEEALAGQPERAERGEAGP